MMVEQKKKGVLTPAAEILASRSPELRRKLRLADLGDDPVAFLDRALQSTLFISLGLLFIAYLFLMDPITAALRTGILVPLLLVLCPLIVVPPIVFAYLMLYPDAMAIRREREMDYEVVFAGRHIVIALKSGMPLFDTFVGASTGYGAVSREFSKIVDMVVLGVPVNQAVRDVTQNNPSKYFTRMMLQMANAVASGADVGDSIESVLDQISKEQLITLKEYSQKLTPIVMFYMIFGIVVPSLGIVLATVIFSAISGGNFGFAPPLLVVVFVIIALIQFLFLGFIESSRPRYLL